MKYSVYTQVRTSLNGIPVIFKNVIALAQGMADGLDEIILRQLLITSRYILKSADLQLRWVQMQKHFLERSDWHRF